MSDLWFFFRQNLRAVQDGKVAIVDGNQMFARPGPRLVDALEFLVGLLHNKPELIPKDFPWTYWDTHMQGRHADAVHTPAARHSSSMACTDDSAATVASDTRSLTEQDDVSSSIDKPDSKQDGQEAQQAQRAQQTAPCQQLNSLERKWRAAPYLGPEIEEAHASAIEAGQSTYVDPATGYQVLSWLLHSHALEPWLFGALPSCGHLADSALLLYAMTVLSKWPVKCLNLHTDLCGRVNRTGSRFVESIVMKVYCILLS